MLFPTVSSFVLLALASIATAQNPFSFDSLTSIKAGDNFNITWSPSTGTVDTVTLLLRDGNKAALNDVLTIASNIKNTGSYLWSVPSSIDAGTTYAFEIVDNGNSAIVNYSNQFTIISSVTAPVSSVTATGSASTASETATGATVTASTTTASSPSGSASSSSKHSTQTSTTAKTTLSKTSSSASTTSPSASPVQSVVNLNGAKQGQAVSLFGAVVAIGMAVAVAF